MLSRAAAAGFALLAACAPLRADVVINELFYHAPDDLDGLQFVELHNTADAPADLGGWKFTRGVKYDFPPGTRIDAGGYLVLCKDAKLFKRYYGFDPAGQFDGSLSHGGEAVELRDAAGRKVDELKYKTRDPWPLAPDGYSSSLERVCPTAPGAGPENWAPSPLPAGGPRPAGTPGKRNATYSPRLPPAVAGVTVSPAHAAPGQEVKVEADVRGGDGLAVELRYRVAGPGRQSEEKAVRMEKSPQGRYAATIPGQKAGQIVRLRVRATDSGGGVRFYPHENEVRPALSVYVHDKFDAAKVPLGFIINVGAAEFRAAQQPGGGGGNPPARGNSAFVWVDPKTGAPELFDFVTVPPRPGGRKVRLHRDHLLAGMSTINLQYETDRAMLCEPMSYEVYRRAGVPAPRTDYVRTWVDGRPLGFQLLIEQPNKAFLRRSGLNADGNLYKSVWWGGSVVERHEKKTHVHEGHDDLLRLVDRLEKTRGDEQWAVIKKEFDVEEMINLYAVHMLTSDWDGFFNNYYLYHDARGTGRWSMYPWDKDKTWGLNDGVGGYDVFAEMPLTFGMAGDRPRDGAWWRPGGDVSKPLLANPQFRRHFLARLKELLETVYTPNVMLPVIRAAGEKIAPEVEVWARLRREDPRRAAEHFRRIVDSLREHLTKRRKFLLDQPEVKAAGRFDRDALK